MENDLSACLALSCFVCSSVYSLQSGESDVVQLWDFWHQKPTRIFQKVSSACLLTCWPTHLSLHLSVSGFVRLSICLWVCLAWPSLCHCEIRLMYCLESLTLEANRLEGFVLSSKPCFQWYIFVYFQFGHDVVSTSWWLWLFPGEDFGRMFDYSFPACALIFLIFFKVEIN